jgi:hypothetical protein
MSHNSLYFILFIAPALYTICPNQNNLNARIYPQIGDKAKLLNTLDKMTKWNIKRQIVINFV